MDMLEGIVEHIRYSTSVSGDEHGTASSQVAVFDVGHQPVEIALSESIAIKNGDDILVAGKSIRGLFRGLAYYNKTNGVKGKESTWI